MFYSKPTTRPLKNKPTQLESFNFLREHYINYKQPRSTFIGEMESSHGGAGSLFKITQGNSVENDYIFTSDKNVLIDLQKVDVEQKFEEKPQGMTTVSAVSLRQPNQPPLEQKKLNTQKSIKTPSSVSSVHSLSIRREILPKRITPALRPPKKLTVFSRRFSPRPQQKLTDEEWQLKNQLPQPVVSNRGVFQTLSNYFKTPKAAVWTK